MPLTLGYMQNMQGLSSATPGAGQGITPLGIGPSAVVLTPFSIVTAGDSTGIDGFSPFGTQTYFGDNITWWCAAYSKGALQVNTSCSFGGWTTADIDKNWEVRIASKRTTVVLLCIGLNDIHTAADDVAAAAVELYLRKWIMRRVSDVLAWGGIPVLQTMFPVGATYSTATKRQLHFEHNKWRRQYGQQCGLPVLDCEMLGTDPASATADPYAAYFQPNPSPHPGKEIIRTAGKMLWDMLAPLFPAPPMMEQANRYTANQVFTNPTLTGTAGNVNGGNAASVLPDNVWGWQTGTHTTYSVVASTDSKFSFAGAPVKSNWVSVSTDTSQLPVAANGVGQSSATPGLLFFSTGYNFKAGDTFASTCELEIVTPNTLLGFFINLASSDGTVSFSNPASGNAFTPVVNADNAKNHLLTPTVLTIPINAITLSQDLTGGGIWLSIRPHFSGLSGATGSAVWRVRNVKIWKVATPATPGI